MLERARHVVPVQASVFAGPRCERGLLRPRPISSPHFAKPNKDTPTLRPGKRRLREESAIAGGLGGSVVQRGVGQAILLVDTNGYSAVSASWKGCTIRVCIEQLRRYFQQGSSCRRQTPERASQRASSTSSAASVAAEAFSSLRWDSRSLRSTAACSRSALM